jgi:hypothetical protein
MSVRKILNASAGYTASTATVSAPSDTSFGSTSLLLTGDPSVVDDNFANVSLLLTGNDLLDKSNNKATITNTGSVAVSNTVKKFGTGSMSFNGTTGYLSIPDSTAFDLSSNTFTIEAWVYQTSNSGNAIYSYVVDKRGGGGTYGLLLNSGVPSLMYGASMAEALGTQAIPLNTWTHIAASVSSGTLRMYINGVQTYTTTGLTFPVGTAPVWIGRPNTYGYYFAGYIDDLRITKGVARYTTNFTPPTQALPSHEILDSSVYSLPVTAYGNARIDTATKKYGTGSMYFDGSGDYLTLLPNINLAFPADFTIELWFNSSSFAAQRTLISTAGYYVAGNNGNWTFRVSNASSIAFAQYNSQSAAGGGWEFPVPAMSTGTWYHVAVARSNGTISLYLNGTASSTTYSNSSNIGDGSVSNVYVGHNASYDNDWIGYVDDLRITKGYARYTANFTPPTAALPTTPPTIAADPWWGNVSLLLDGNTTDAYDPYWQNVSLMLTGDDFIDWSNNHLAITNTNITLSNTIKKYGTSSLAFSGVSGNALSISGPGTTNSIGTGDFTVEAWAYYLDILGWRDIICFVGPTSWGITTNNGDLGAYGIGINASGTIVPINQWFHVAVTRQSGTVRLFLNGVLVASATNTTSFTTTQINIGSWSSTTSENLNGYIAELRMTKGIARYTANFTPPIAALPSYKIKDRTQNNLTITPYGNVQLSTDVKKNGTGSMFFDGVGDNVSIANTPYLTLGTGDFTIEAWFNQISQLPYAHLFTTTTSYGTTNGLRITTNGNFNVLTSNTGLISGVGSFTNGTWQHFALVRSGTTLTIYQNGISVGTATTSVSFVMDTFMVGGEGTYPFNGYIDDFRVTKGVARYTSNFTPPSQSFATQYISTGFDPNYADVSLLLTGEGTNGSTTFTDLSSSPKTITKYGNAQISTAQKKYGTGSMSFGGSGSYIAFDDVTGLGSNNFTIDFWMYVNASGWDLFSLGATANTDYAGFAFVNSGAVYASNTGTSWPYAAIGCGQFPLSTWIHMAFVRDGDSLRIYNNGVLASTTAISGSFANKSGKNFIGVKSDNMTYGFNGYVDDFRITKNVVRYTTNFTPPTYALATTAGTAFDVNRADTSLLLRGNGTNGSTSFTDESPNNLTVTNNGSVTVNTANKKYGTGSMAFSGSNYLSIANDALFQLSGDYTIEAWVYTTSNSSATYQTIASKWTTNNYAWIFQFNNANIQFASGNSGSLGALITKSCVLSTNTWYHVSVVRASSTVRIFVNGIQQGTNVTDASNCTNTVDVAIGRNLDIGVDAQYLTGYIDDLRITKGYARYTANFTPPTYEDPIVTGTQYDYNYAQVSLLLNGDGTNGSTTFTDLSSSPKTITNNGSVTVNTSVKKFGTGSIYFNTNSYLRFPVVPDFNLSTNDFTYECWYYPVSRPTTYPNIWSFGFSLCDRHANAPSNFSLYMLGWSGIVAGSVTVANNTWYHLAVTRTGNTIKLYVNGTLDITASYSGVVDSGSYGNNYGIIGSDGTNYINAYIDDFRITKGLARYTQNFTPPTAPLPTSGGY